MANSKRQLFSEAPPARSEQTSQDERGTLRSVGSSQQQKHQCAADRRRQWRNLGRASTLEKDLGVVGKNNVEAATKVGTAIAERAKEAGVEEATLIVAGSCFTAKVSRPWPTQPVKAGL